MFSAGQAELPYFVALCREPDHHSHIRRFEVVSPARQKIESRAPVRRGRKSCAVPVSLGLKRVGCCETQGSFRPSFSMNAWKIGQPCAPE